MSVQDVLNDFGSKVASLEAAEDVVDTREEELSSAQVELDNANGVQHDAKVAAKVSFNAVLAEVALLDLDSVTVDPFMFFESHLRVGSCAAAVQRYYTR